MCFSVYFATLFVCVLLGKEILFPICLLTGRILGDVNLNLDDKTALKARGLWEDWHLRQIIDQPRTNHLSGKIPVCMCMCMCMLVCLFFVYVYV